MREKSKDKLIAEVDSLQTKIKQLEDRLKESEDTKAELLQGQKLSFEFGIATDLPKELNDILDNALKIHGVDCGAIYLLNSQTNNLELAQQKGLPDAFTNKNLQFSTSSPQAKQVLKGEAQYSSFLKLYPEVDKNIFKEQIKAFVIIPLMHNQQLIGTLHLGSHILNAFPQQVRKSIETFSAPLGSMIYNTLVPGEKTDDSQSSDSNILKSVMKHLPAVLFRLDKKGVFTLSEGKGLEQLDLKPGQVVGKSAIEMYKDFPEIVQSIKQALSGKITRSIHNMGNIVFDVLYTPEYSSDGKIESVTGIATDITEQIRADQKIRQNEDQLIQKNTELEALINAIPGVMYMFDSEGHLFHWNNLFLEFFGYSAREASKINILDLVPDQNKPRVEKLFKEVFEKGEVSLEIEAKAKNGAIKPLYARGSRFIRSDGAQFIIGIGIDISDRVKALNALKESEERYRKLVEISPDAISMTDLEGKFVMVNPKTAEMYGFDSVDELIGTDSMNLVAEEDKKKVIDMVANGNPVSKLQYAEYSNIKKDGTMFPIEINGTRITDGQGNHMGYISIVRDITERKKLEQELLKSKKLESIGVLAGGIAHDFNNLLTAILGNISFAKMDLDAKEKVFTRLTEAEKASYRAKNLTQQLLTFSRGGMPVKKILNLPKLIKESASFALSGSNVECVYHFSKNLSAVKADEGQINQVINNVVLNAEQSMPEGGEILIAAKNTTIKSAAETGFENEKYVKITIEDQGNGIAKEHLNQVFDPYYTTKKIGNGLGLTTSYFIIKKHEGQIKLDSELGNGTTVEIFLPASEDVVNENEQKIDAGKNQKVRVLLMDDEKNILLLTEEILTTLGYEVECAMNGEEAVRLYEQAMKNKQPFETVIMDLTIRGGMGGKETIQELQKIDPDVKAIVSSGYASNPVMSNYKEHGFSDVLEKPYQFKELQEAIVRVIGNNSHS